MTKSLSRAILVGLFIAVPFVVTIAQEKISKDTTRLNRVARSIEDTWGILDKGELINVCSNTGGIITDSYERSTMYVFRWPKSKGLASNTGDVNAVNRQGVMFGCKGNVIDSYSNRFNEDWQGVLAGAGKYYADDQSTDLRAPDGAPRMAHSDIPKTWPAGYFDSLKVWNPSPVGDLNTLSAADQTIVTSKGAWYDEEKNIWRFWPGRFRIDMDTTSATYQKQIIGEFAADREVYTIISDRNTQTPDIPLGIVLEMQAYCWGSRFGQDIQFYDFTITNTSSVVLDSCTWGYLLDFRYGDANQEGYFTFNSGINSAGYDNVFINWDYNGATDPIRGINNGYFGSAIFATPKDLGVTDGHFFRMNTTYMPKKSNRTIWPVMISNPSDPAFQSVTNGASNFFHGGANTHFDVFDSTYLVPSRWDFTQFAGVFATSLFTLNPGESVRGCIAYTAASTVDQFKRNIAIAQKLFLAEFNGPSVPPSPKLFGTAGDRRNTLYWSDDPEHARDILSKKLDFQGYKIYRSEDQGATWGKAMVDNQGRVIGYIPVAQFDKNDDISGTDPLSSFNYLGSNTGLQHMWVDSSVTNGTEYSYTITSYDAGDPASLLESYESSRGTTAADYNLVDLTPRSDAAGYQSPFYTLSKSATVGKATVKVSIADPNKVSTNPYKIGFNKAIADTFYLYSQNDSLLATVPMTSDEMKVIDGIRLRLETDAQIGGIKKISDEAGKTVSSSTSKNSANYWFVTLKNNYGSAADTTARGSDYEFRFTQRGSYVDTSVVNNQKMTARINVPFELWNVTNPDAPQQINAVLEDANGNAALNLGEGIRIVNLPYLNPNGIGDSLGVYATSKVPYSFKIDTLSQDSLYGAKLPVIGQSFKVATYSAVTQRDTFYLQMTKASLTTPGATPQQLLSRIRVVPNPYIGAAKWEQVQNTRKLQFSFLPPVCTISIFTIRGELVNRLQHTNLTGTEEWNLTNRSGVEVAFGLYIYIVELPDGNKSTGKLAIIK